jgi:flagellar biosynthetic protein FliP
MVKFNKNYIKLSFFIIITFFSVPVFAQSIASGMPALNITDQGNGETTYSLSLQILALMTALTVLPSLVLGMTSFTRIIIVLSILRQAMGTQQTPPNQVLIAIALFLSFFIMSPTLTKIYDESITPFMAEELSAEAAISSGSKQIKEFYGEKYKKK